MKKLNIDQYYVGLDMGVSSVGFAATDPSYNILHFQDKPIYGSRLMDSMNENAERRANRASRRRLQKEKERLEFLNSVFLPLIEPDDPDFFSRLKNSLFLEDDKEGLRNNSRNIVFNDPDYKDKNYRRDYPTISHLKMALIWDEVPADKRYARLVYLALHQFLVKRGNFLNEWMSDEFETVHYQDELSSLWKQVSAAMDFDLNPLTESVVNETEEIFLSAHSRSLKKDTLLKSFAASVNPTETKAEKQRREKYLKNLLNALLGLKFSASELMDLRFEDEETKKTLDKIGLRDSDLDDKTEQLRALADDQQMEILESVRRIHDGLLLKNMIGDCSYLSEARIRSYETYREDLVALKSLVKEFCPEKYDAFFRELHPNNYSHYVHRTKYYDPERKELVYIGRTDGKSENKGTSFKFDYKKFLKKVEELLVNVPDENEDKQRLKKHIEEETLFQKQMSGENSIIPYQLHLKELKAILKNAQKYLPDLKKMDPECNLTEAEKIIEVFKFRKPFYVGPTNTGSPLKNEDRCWAVRTEGGKVMPWNLKEKIDIHETRKRFIERMVKSCSYLPDETAMPKQSIEYEKFTLLNQLNTISINGHRLDENTKKKLYEYALSHPRKKITKKFVLNFLEVENAIGSEDKSDLSVTGMDQEITARITSLPKFQDLFERSLLTARELEIAEQIIFRNTVFGKDKESYLAWLKKEYETELTEKQIQKASRFSFSGWGSLSKAFIHLEGMNKETGEIKELIQLMEVQSKNLNELLFDSSYNFEERIEQHQKKIPYTISSIKFEDLEEFRLNPQVKRSVWQAILILRDIIKATGSEPARLFIEMPRSKMPLSMRGSGKRTSSRRDQLNELYKSGEFEMMREELSKLTDIQLSKDKFYLYFLQRGKDIYTGEPIDLNDLIHSNDPTKKYDIDHIWPQNVTLDDSVRDNKVLTNKNFNEKVKGGDYPVPAETREKMTGFWKELRKAGLMTEEKYSRLTRSTEFSDKERADFINRQLVDTSYSTKVTAHLMESLLKNTEVVYSRPKLVDDFRKRYQIIKVRELNDLHHAEDAYLNIVTGNVYYSRFTKSPKRFIEQWKAKKSENKNALYSVGKIFERNVVTKDGTVWIADQEKKDGTVIQGTSAVIEQNIEENTPIVTKKVGQKTKAVVRKVSIFSPKVSNKTALPLKTSDPRFSKLDRYGSYDSATTAFFILVQDEDKRGKKTLYFKTVPTYLADKVGKSSEELKVYCKKEFGFKNPTIICQKIPVGTLFLLNGYPLRVTGKSGPRLSVQIDYQLQLNKDQKKYLKVVLSAVDKTIVDSRINAEANLQLFDALTDKLQQLRLEDNDNKKAVSAVLREKRDLFEKASIENQICFLTRMLDGFKGKGGMEFKGLLGLKSFGHFQPSHKVTDRLYMITSSASGLFSKRELVWDGEQ